MPQIAQSPLRGFMLALAGFALFAVHDALIKSLGGVYSPFQIILFATLFAFVPLTFGMLTDRAVDTFRPKHPWLILARTACMLIAGSSAFYAFAVLPMAEVYALLFATPLLVTILAIPLLGEVVRLRRWAAVIVGLIGVMVVLRPGSAEFTMGHGAALLAALSSAFSNIIVRRIGSEERSAVLILIPMLAGILVMGALMPLVYVPVTLPDLGALALIGVLGVLAQVLIIAAFRRTSAVIVAPVQYSQILWAVLFGLLFFDESPDLWVGIGATIIIASGAFIVWRESRAQVSSQSPVLRQVNPRPDAGPSPRPKGARRPAPPDAGTQDPD